MPGSRICCLFFQLFYRSRRLRRDSSFAHHRVGRLTFCWRACARTTNPSIHVSEGFCFGICSWPSTRSQRHWLGRRLQAEAAGSGRQKRNLLSLALTRAPRLTVSCSYWSTTLASRRAQKSKHVPMVAVGVARCIRRESCLLYQKAPVADASQSMYPLVYYGPVPSTFHPS